jgi:hypothetical protein
MKNIFLIATLICFAFSTFAQLPTVSSKIKTGYSVKQGNFITLNPTLSDTLASGDTLFYVVSIEHTNMVYPFIVEQWKKTSTADTIVIATYWQSINGFTTAAQATSNSNIATSWKQLNYGTSPGAYSRTVTVTSASTNEIDFWQNIIWFQGRYLGIRYIARAKSGFKYIPQNIIKIPFH